jgi:hypothetical protein
MSPLIPSSLRLPALTLAAIVLVGCSESSVAPTSSRLSPIGGPSLDQIDANGYIYACKDGGLPGTYHFHMDVQGGGTLINVFGPDASVDFDGVNRACAFMAYVPDATTWGLGVSATVTMTEVQIPTGMIVDSVLVFNSTTGIFEHYLLTNPVSHTFAFGSRLWFKYFNSTTPPPPPPPPGGNQGCTPGYWKQKQHFDSWVGTGYTTSQLLSTVFTVPAGYTLSNKGMGTYSMLDALSFQGGSTLSGKAEILLRAAVAGLLNAGKSNIAYGMTTAQIVSGVNAALASNNATTITNLATAIDGLNNGQGGCPLN